MYAYWYEDGQLMAYEGTKTDFKGIKDRNKYRSRNRNSFYTYGEYGLMPNEWFKTDVITGTNSICNIFAEDVPSDIRAMHLLLVKE